MDNFISDFSRSQISKAIDIALGRISITIDSFDIIRNELTDPGTISAATSVFVDTVRHTVSSV